MRSIITLLFLLLSLHLVAQPEKEVKAQVSSLKFVTDMPYSCQSLNTKERATGCGDSYFWNVVKLKQRAIPYLIERISDPTKSKAVVPNFGGQYTVGDIAYAALQEIIKGIPTFELLGIPFDTEGCGYCSYWQHLRKDQANRKAFKQAVDKWYQANKAKMVWVASTQVLTCDCSFAHPNGGHYKIEK